MEGRSWCSTGFGLYNVGNRMNGKKCAMAGWLFLAFLGSFLLLLGAGLYGFDRIATDSTVYKSLQRELDVYGYAGISQDELDAVMEDMAGYLRGEDCPLNREVAIFGVRQPVFNEKELTHMEDVRALFVLERSLHAAALPAGAALLAVSLYLSRGRAKRMFCLALGMNVLLTAGVAALLMTASFDVLFLRFHQLLFTNDLWLMDPRTDAMIRMFPQDFFERIAWRTLVGALQSMGLAIAAAFAAAWLLDGANNRRKKHAIR